MADPLGLQAIHQKLEELTVVARKRMQECDPGIAGVMGGAEFDFMTSEEKELRHQLILSLPSSAQLAREAKLRISERIRQRRIDREEAKSYRQAFDAEMGAMTVQQCQRWNPQFSKAEAESRICLAKLATATLRSAETQHQSSLF